jgi:hypothetical protein
MLDVMKEPTFPARIMLIKVGANSSITDCRVAKPTKFFGISGFSILRAVCMDTTPPTKKDRKATMPKDPIIRSCISLKISFRITFALVGLIKTNLSISIYSPM